MSGFGVSLEALSAITHAVRDGWGDYGYRVQDIAGTWDGSCIAEISHSDGSRFYVAASTYGVVVPSQVVTDRPVPGGFDTPEAAQAALHAQYVASR